jgi:hypothetical protein
MTAMSAIFSPIESEFSSAEESQAYDLWFREQVANSLTDPRPNIPHDVVMAEMRSLIDSKRTPNAG